MKLNTVFNVISKFFTRAFACNSLIVVAMSLFGYMTNTDEYSKYLSVKEILTFFVFSLLFALSFAIADLFKNNVILKRCAQFVLTYLSLAVVFFFGGSFSSYVEANNVQNKGFSILAISFMFVIIYTVCGVIALLFGFIKNKISDSKKQYESIFESKE